MEPSGVTLFSDDIRFEAQNKITLIGCYGPEMLVSGDLPFLLPKLGMLVQLRMSPGSCYPSKILVYLPDSKDEEPTITVEVDAPNAGEIKNSQNLPVDSDLVSLLATNVPILLSPVMINSEGLIKVRVICGDKTIKAGTLKVTRVPKQSTKVG